MKIRAGASKKLSLISLIFLYGCTLTTVYNACRPMQIGMTFQEWEKFDVLLDNKTYEKRCIYTEVYDNSEYRYYCSYHEVIE